MAEEEKKHGHLDADKIFDLDVAVDDLLDPTLAGMIAMAKVNTSKSLEFVCRESMQVFGGRGYLKYGRGGRIERAYRDVRVAAIGGGSEEIMIELGAKMARL